MFVKTFGCVRFIYNRMLADKIKHYEETKQKLNNTPAQYKKEFEWLKEVDSLALYRRHTIIFFVYLKLVFQNSNQRNPITKATQQIA